MREFTNHKGQRFYLVEPNRRTGGCWVAKCKKCLERISHSCYDDLMLLVAMHVCKTKEKSHG